MGIEANPRLRGGQVAAGRSGPNATSTQATPGKRTLVDLQQGVHAPAITGNAPPTEGTGPAMLSAQSLARLARTHMLSVQSALLPAYQVAVLSTDTAAVRMLVQQLVGRVAHVIDAQAEIVRLVPQVDAKTTAALASTAVTDPGQPGSTQLAMLKADSDALDRELTAALGELVVKVSPQMFGGMPTAGFGSIPSEHTFTRFVSEAQVILELMEAADHIGALAAPSDPAHGTSRPADSADQERAVEELSRWKSRPVNFYFLERVLKQRGLWALLTGRDLHGRAPAELARQVDAQSEESGASADLGAWDESAAGDALGAGRLAWPVSSENAQALYRDLTELDPDARAGAMRQLESRGLLDRMCLALPWPAIKQLWEVTPDPRAARLLEPYWLGKADGKSLGRMLDGNVLTRGVSRFLDLATFGAKPKIDAAIDGFAAGEISDSEVSSQASGAVARAGFVAAVMAATGGVAGAYAGGAALGAGLGEGAAMIADGAAAGALGSVGGQLAGDVFDQARGDKQGFDALSSYGRTFASGGLFGTALAPLGLAAGRYLPAGMRTIAQQAAAAHPEWTQVLEAARNVGIGTTTTIRLTVRELLESVRNGGPPGFRFAYAVSGAIIPPGVAHADPSASVVLTARPLTNLNAPANAFRWGDDLVDVERVSLADQVREHFADAGEMGEAPHTTNDDGSLAGEGSRLGEDGPEVAAVGARRTRRDAGMVAQEGGQITDQHHVFPQEQRGWFRDRGIDIDDFCVRIPEVEHRAQHGGGSWRLARKVASTVPEAEWNAAIMSRINEAQAQKKLLSGPSAELTRDEIIRVARSVMARRGLGKLLFMRYRR